MNIHKNARLTPKGRAHLVQQIKTLGLTPAAAAAGVSRRTARKWQRLTYAVIAERVGLSTSTVARICAAAGVARLPPLHDTPPVRRYERKTAGELLHLDTKRLARFAQPGHRVTGDRTRYTRRAGHHALHVAIDDHSRVGFSLMLPDETAKSACRHLFWQRCATTSALV